MILELVAQFALGVGAPASLVSVPLVAAPGAVATKANASTVLAEVQKRYARVTQISMGFRQTVTNVTFGVTKSSEGEVRLVRPDRMRWDHRSAATARRPIKKSFISDGKTLQLIDHDNMEIIKRPAKDDVLPVMISFLHGKGDLKSTHTATLDASGRFGASDERVLKLVPRRPSLYKALYLVVDAHHQVTRSVVIDASGNINDCSFHDPDTTTAIDPTVFVVEPAATRNYRVVDATQP